MDMVWYEQLVKPSWTPAPATIGLVWRILYPIILVSFGYVFVQTARKRWPIRAAIPFALNLVANLAFTPVQFGLKNLPLACAVILVVLATIPWAMIVAWPRSKIVALAQIPYLVWVSIATVLQFSITLMNPGR